ncbi:MAG: branched-chain amino acid ABC transporter permease [Armatimonadota bacterium]|nr:branched-chain amino acid ABC transporter permease [Armatimonadota bacterium]MDR5696433.1 branched-chain amino acid ABC transporter permease [Armatimonadota bacterium]
MTPAEQIAQFVASGIVNGAIYALLGLGLVTIHAVTRTVNVAQGEFAAFGALLAASVVAAGLPVGLGLVIAVPASAALGWALYHFGIRPVGTAPPIVLLIVTIAAHLALKGILLIGWGTDPYNLPPFTIGEPVRIAQAVVSRQSLWVVGAVIVVLAVLYLFFTRTLLGRALRACAVNDTAARLVGIRVEAMGALAWTLAGALGGLAGVLITPVALATYDMGLLLGLKGFVGAVAAGFVSYPLTVLACVLFGVVESLGAGLVSSHYRDAIAFGVLIGAMLWRAALALREGVLVSEEAAQE